MPGTEKSVCCLLLLLLLAVFASGCAVQARPDYKPALVDQGELYFYLQPLPQEMLPLAFSISDVSVISEQGETTTLLKEELLIKGSEHYNIQKKLFSGTLTPGRYTGISLAITEATIATEEGDMNLLVPAKPLRLDLDFTIRRGRSLALFLELPPEFLVADGYKFTPRFTLAKPHLIPKNYLGFISSTAENIITVFNKRNMEITQVIRTGSGTKGLALDQKNGIVYAALAGEDAIALINIDTMEPYGRIRLRSGDEPTEIVLSPDGETLISTNYGTGSISLIDTGSLSEAERFILQQDPVWVATDRAGRRAYVLSGLTNSILVIDPGNRRVLATISLDEAPWRGDLSRDGDRLYIISQYSTELRIIDTVSRRIAGSIFIGSGAASITVDPRNDLIYIGKKSGEIVVVDPAAGMFIDSFPVEGDAAFMTIDGEENVLLVLSNDHNRMFKINLVSKRVLAYTNTEKLPHGLAVMGEF